MKTKIAGAALALALVAGACGDSDSDDSSFPFPETTQMTVDNTARAVAQWYEDHGLQTLEEIQIVSNRAAAAAGRQDIRELAALCNELHDIAVRAQRQPDVPDTTLDRFVTQYYQSVKAAGRECGKGTLDGLERSRDHLDDSYFWLESIQDALRALRLR